MLRKEMLHRLNVLATEELHHANQVHPLFASCHEGYAVLKEEVEEASEKILEIGMNLQVLWEVIRKDGVGLESAEHINKIAIECAAECVQVAAMCGKYSVSHVIGNMGR